MFIEKVVLKNFKCFTDNVVEFNLPDGSTPGSGLNIMVGQNNSGKSSLFEAIHFLRNKAKKEVKRIGAVDDSEFYVELTFTGELDHAIENFVQENKQKAFKDSIEESPNGSKKLRVRRVFKNDEEQKKILFFDANNNVFINKSGIDAPFQAFFQISNIWADTNPETESKMGSSTVCGNLLADISEKFKLDHAVQYEYFLKVFVDTFNDPTAGLQKDLNEVARETQQILNKQFGRASLRFKFDNPEFTSLFKNIKILVDDGEETELSDKGHGMQRAVILSLLQVYASRITKFQKENGDEGIKPHFLFIDEPEMGLHPQAQRQLFEALRVLSTTHQVFVSTHSENFIAIDLIENIYKFHRLGDVVTISSGKNLNIALGVNRKFFFHHHRLFFAERAIFLEGVDDFERYPAFCMKNGFGNLIKDFYMLAGCGDFSVFKIFCEHFKIRSYFLFDIDVLAWRTNTTLKKISPLIWGTIVTLNKETTKKDPANLLSINLTIEENALKSEVISKLVAHSIFVLSDGAIEQYLDEESELIAEDPAFEEKKAELYTIFGIMNSNIPYTPNVAEVIEVAG